MRNRSVRAFVVALLTAFCVTSARADVTEVRISRGFGVLYLPLMVMESEKLLDKQCAARAWATSRSPTSSSTAAT